MTSGDFWSDAQRTAWDYVKSAVGSGLKQIEALQAYRSGGGAIRTQSWGELWHRQSNAVETWDTLYQYKQNDLVPNSLFEKVDINYQGKYTMQFKANIRDPMGNIIHDMYRQVSSDRLLTVDQWKEAAVNSLMGDASQMANEVIALEDVQFYQRMK